MLLLCLPAVTAGWMAARLPHELAMFAIALIIMARAMLGGRLITLYAFGTPVIQAHPADEDHSDQGHLGRRGDTG